MVREQNPQTIRPTNHCPTFCQPISYNVECQNHRYKNTEFDVAQTSLNDQNDVSYSLNVMRSTAKRSDLSDVQNSSSGDREQTSSLWDSFWSTPNSDTTDHSSFISATPSNTNRINNNEYSLHSHFDDSSSSSDNSGRSAANCWNFDCSNEYSRERYLPTTCDANLFNSENVNQLELLRCILSMSKEQLERLVRVIYAVIRNPQSFDERTRKQVDKPGIQSSLSALCQFAESNDKQFSQDLFAAASVQKSNIPYSLFSENDGTLKQKGRDRHTITVRGMVKAALSWNGEIPKLSNCAPFSRKVFVGGLPHQITEKDLQSVFDSFGTSSLVWPRKEHFKGYVYVIFEKEAQVRNLLKSCREYKGDLYFTLPLKTKSKEVQIIPWSILDNSYPTTEDPSTSSNSPWMVYVGGLHGIVNAHGLFRIMDNLFGKVIHAGICVDKQKYPTGSGQVIFDSHDSYAKAISVGFVEIRTSKFSKPMQIEPFLKDSICSICSTQVGPYFCRESSCFRYFCGSCWRAYHKALRLPHDAPLMKNSKLADFSAKLKKRTNLV